jgi:hypothetical protein
VIAVKFSARALWLEPFRSDTIVILQEGRP